MDKMSKMLRAIRAIRNLTQEEVADKSGIPASTISRFETGRYNINPDEMQKIQDALGVDFHKVQSEFERFLRAIGDQQG